MKLINEQLVSDLLETGKKEFLAKGFQKASMRNIAAKLNVTTGAIYRYYKDKETLFDAIVREAADTLEARYKDEQNKFSEMPLEYQINDLPKVTEEEYDWMIEYIYENYDAFKLIICCSNETQYEHYIDRLIDIEVESSHKLVEKMQKENILKHKIDDKLIHIVATTLFSGIFENIAHDIPKNDAIEYVKQLRDFYSAGWFKMFGIDQSS